MGLTQSNPWRGVRFGYVFSFVIPAKAGIQLTLNRMSSNWIPAYAGMTGMGTHTERTSCQKVQRQELPVGWIRLPASTPRIAKTARSLFERRNHRNRLETNRRTFGDTAHSANLRCTDPLPSPRPARGQSFTHQIPSVLKAPHKAARLLLSSRKHNTPSSQAQRGDPTGIASPSVRNDVVVV